MTFIEAAVTDRAVAAALVDAGWKPDYRWSLARERVERMVAEGYTENPYGVAFLERLGGLTIVAPWYGGPLKESGTLWVDPLLHGIDEYPTVIELEKGLGVRTMALGEFRGLLLLVGTDGSMVGETDGMAFLLGDTPAAALKAMIKGDVRLPRIWMSEHAEEAARRRREGTQASE